MQEQFNIISTSRETFINDFLLLDNEYLVKSIFMNWDLCLSTWDNNDKKIVTINDVFNTRWLNEDEIVIIIYNRTGINIRTVEWIEKLNKLFTESVNFLKDVLYRKVWNEIKRNKDCFFSTLPNWDWKLWNDVIKFLRETEKWKRVSQTHCRIAKTIYSINDVLANPEIVESEKNAKDIIQTQIAPWIQIEDFNMLMNYNKSNCTIVLGWKIINFKLKFRWKEDRSALLKIIYYPEYNATELLKDPIWMELICEKEEDSILLLNHFYLVLFREKISGIKNKWYDIEKYSSIKWLHEWFKNSLLSSSSAVKPTANKWYMDIKMLWKIKWLLVEFRSSIKWNKQTDILKSDEVYFLSKILLTCIRLDWYITDNYIKLVINNFFLNYPEHSKKLTKEKLLKYLSKPLLQVDRWHKCIIYTSDDRYNTLSDTEFYSKNIKKK